MTFSPRLLIVVGAPGSGKDLLIRAVADLGSQHAQIVPKHTSRQKRADDGDEMICPDDRGYDLDSCDVVYENYGDRYGIESGRIWNGLRHGIFQVAVISNVGAMNKLRELFGPLVILVYVHSQASPEQYRDSERKTQNQDETEYISRRSQQYRNAFDLYLTNFLAFDHVLINSAEPEDLFDQIFRLFRAYERRDLY